MQAEETSEAYKGLTEFLQKTLGERVEKVAVSRRLADSPCALVTSKFGWSAYQERIMKSQVRLPVHALLRSHRHLAVSCVSRRSML
jgi:HSP90 family molecular chaperone